MMKPIKTIIQIAFVMLSGAVFSQSTNADSLLAVLSRSSDDNEKIEALNQLFKLAFNSDAEKARNYGQQVVGLSKKTGNKLALAIAYKDIGVTFLLVSNFDSAQYYNQLAKQEFEKLLRRNDGTDRAKILEGYAGLIANIGNWFYYQSALDSAVQYQLRAVELSGQSGIEKAKANALGTLASIYVEQAKYDQAIALYFEALHTFERLGNQDGISRSYQGIGQINCDYLNKCQPALDYFRKALGIKKKIGSERGIAYVFRLLGDAHKSLSALDSANYYYEKTIELAKKIGDKRLLIDGYSGLADNEKELDKPRSERIKTILKFIVVAKEIEREDALAVGYSNLSQIYAEGGDYEKAVSYANQAISLAAEQKNYRSLKSLYYTLYIIYKNHLHDQPQALAALEAYLVNHDSVSNAEKFRAVEDINTQYETEKKENTIALQKEALRHERVRFWFIAGFLVLALAVGALLFRLTRILRQRNAEKEFLIKEIHHRVKNNLQVLSSLLHLQSRHIRDETALHAVREGQNRVDAMGLIHQKLYMGENLAAVEMGDYLRELSDTLLDTFGLDDGRVQIVCRLEPLRLDVDTAIPLGLIINELATNSLKYAFPGDRTGTLEIALWKDESGRLCLRVSDDGVGKTGAATDAKKGTGFGTNLVEMLAKKLKGKPETTSGGNGYATVIRFEQFKEA